MLVFVSFRFSIRGKLRTLIYNTPSRLLQVFLILSDYWGEGVGLVLDGIREQG